MTVPIITRAGPLLERYRVLFCDVWGVVHDGITAYPGANDAFPRFRQSGGIVVLVSNAPRPGDSVARLLDQKAVRREVWDDIVTSGDLALRHIAEAGYKRLHRIGPARRDRDFFDVLPGPHADIEQAEALVCTGLNRDREEQPEAYLPLLGQDEIGVIRAQHVARYREVPNATLAIDGTRLAVRDAAGADRMGSKPADYQARLAARFAEMAAAEPGRWRVIDADAPADAVTAAILAELEPWL